MIVFQRTSSLKTSTAKTQIYRTAYKSNLCCIIDRFVEESKENIDWFSDALKVFYRLLQALHSCTKFRKHTISDGIPECSSATISCVTWKLGLVVGIQNKWACTNLHTVTSLPLFV